jgi:protein-disulfide isomerase
VARSSPVATTHSRTGVTAAGFLAALLACGQPGPPARQLKVPVADSPQRGPSDAWVTVVEFADFECVFCRGEEPVLAEIEATYGRDLRLVFKNFPLHPHAQAAAVAACCAGDQGKFWEMHDLLFGAALDEAALVAAAKQVPGLVLDAWQACIVTPDPVNRIAADVALATELEIGGTPTFVVNGVEVVGAVPESDLRATIDHARDVALASGIPRADYYDKAVLGK